MFSGRTLHLDGPLLIALLFLSALGLVVIFSAADQDWDVMMRQAIRLGVSLVAMVVLAQVSPETLRRLSPHLFLIALVALLGVLFVVVRHAKLSHTRRKCAHATNLTHCGRR